jgi:predicted MPP superfamily phosphohydrolase
MKKNQTKEFFRKLHQKKATRAIVYIFINLIFPLLAAYAQFIETRRLEVTRKIIEIPNLPEAFEGFKIIHISDIHIGPTNKSDAYFKKCVGLINELEADLVAITGDFIQWSSTYTKTLASHLSNIKSKYGVFACLGNHDYGICHPNHPQTDMDDDYTEVISELENVGVRVLHNEQTQIEVNNKMLTLVGLGDLWTEHFKPTQAFAFKTETPTLLLSHNPDSIFSVMEYSFDLMLAGHVHGGQISFPFVGPLVVPVKNRHLRRGLHRISNHWLHVTRGLGYIFKARLLSRPEIACLELRSSQPPPGRLEEPA